MKNKPGLLRRIQKKQLKIGGAISKAMMSTKVRYLLFALLLFVILFLKYLIRLKNVDSSPVLDTVIDEKVDEKETPNKVQEDHEIDDTKRVFFNSKEEKYNLIGDNNSILVRKASEFNEKYSEIGKYYFNDEIFTTLKNSNKIYIYETLSPDKNLSIYTLTIQDPNSDINYRLVQSMYLCDKNTREQRIIPFPKDLMSAVTLWDLNKRKVYISARKPEGLDFSFKWYYEYNLDSGDFRLIATSDDFIQEYEENDKKKFLHFTVGLSDIDRTGNNIIAVGAGAGEPVLLSIWKLNPANREIVKLFDSKVDYPTSKDFYFVNYGGIDVENNRILLNNISDLFSFDLDTGEITKIGKYVEETYQSENVTYFYTYIRSEVKDAEAVFIKQEYPGN